ncbi:hypothetical protein LTS08_002368 [Lithohypha guttulata]|nr:hypothetical protein LTS08_002368 [Lithohypha guttulata]
MPSTVKLADYLFTRLRQLGVGSIHGVPGDYNLTLLDYVEPNKIQWIGNCNELNAGYAADGYARIKGLGALITTFGVGELSAANAIAGSYAEKAPVVHIVGTPARKLQDSRALIHHTFNDGAYERFALMAEQITIAQASLRDPRTCPEMIDRIIQQCLIHSRPVYIQIPADMVSVAVAADRLESVLMIPEYIPSNDQERAVEYTLDRIYSSKQPMILVDGECKAYGITKSVQDFIKLTNWPTYTSAFAKSLINEGLPNFHGIWRGSSAADEDDRNFVQSCDLTLCFGPHLSTTNSYAGSSRPDPAITLYVKSNSVEANEQLFQDLPARDFLSLLLEKLDKSRVPHCTKPPKAKGDTQMPTLDGHAALTQADFYRKLNPLLRSGDIILAETGTPGYGAREFKLPQHTHLFKPVTWLSIGYMLPAAQGAAVAQREMHREGKWPQDPVRRQQPPRTILLIGDGSFQMTVQEISTMVRENLNILIILINNDGYTIERCIHGWNKAYNNVARWRYLQAPSLFGAAEPTQTYSIKTWEDLDNAMQEEEEAGEAGLRMWEVFMERMDAPAMLLELPGAQEAKRVAQNHG